MTHPTVHDALALRDTMAAHARTLRGEDRVRIETWAWALADIARELAAAQAVAGAVRQRAGMPRVESMPVRRWQPIVVEGGI